MANELKRDDNATENIEFELPDTPFMMDGGETDNKLSSPRDIDNISVSALFESDGDDPSEPSEGEANAVEDASEPSEDEANAVDNASEPSEDEANAVEDASEPSEEEANAVENASEPSEDEENAVEDASKPSGEELPDGEELFAPDFAPQFEATEIDIDNEELAAIVEEVIPVSIIEEGSTDAVADNTAEATDSEADSPVSATVEDISERARIIPEDLFPDDAFAPPETDSEGRPIITDLLGNIIEEEPIPEESEDKELECPAIEIPDEVDEAMPSPVREESYNPDKPRRIDAIFDFVELLIFTLVSVLCLTSFFVRHAVVEGGSMMNTLQDGDVLLISDLFYSPAPGDIVVVEDYTTMLKKPIVKRVIAVEGQIVRVTKNDIFINGKPITEEYVYTDDPEYEYPIVSNEELRQLPGFVVTREYYEFMVPEDEIFVMGDHRDDSTDSRIIGTVKVEAVLGKALLRLFPFDKFGEID